MSAGAKDKVVGMDKVKEKVEEMNKVGEKVEEIDKVKEKVEVVEVDKFKDEVEVDKENDKKSAEVAAEIKAIQKEIEEMESETEKLRELTQGVEDTAAMDSLDVDRRSVYVGNVDYGSTPEELEEFFRSCGKINRITILVDKFSGCAKGFAYVEFGDEQSVANAVLLNDALFRGRQLQVMQKRTNLPGKGMKGGGKGKGKPFFKGHGKKGYAPWSKGADYSSDWSGKGYAPYY